MKRIAMFGVLAALAVTLTETKAQALQVQDDVVQVDVAVQPELAPAANEVKPGAAVALAQVQPQVDATQALERLDEVADTMLLHGPDEALSPRMRRPLAAARVIDLRRSSPDTVTRSPALHRSSCSRRGPTRCALV